MINIRPNNTRYRQGLYIPKNKEKVIELNTQGGLYYRSSLEHKVMVHFDFNENVIKWSTENIKVPYTKTEYRDDVKDLVTTEHVYYPDFYYELLKPNGSISQVIAEVKPAAETKAPKLPTNPTSAQLRNFEYAIKMYNKNLSKWTYMIDFCKKRGYDFIIITDETLKR